MNINNLVKMANQIGDFFDAMPDRAAAEQDILRHLERSWDPRMLAEIDAHVHQGGEGLSEIVLAALSKRQQSV